MTHPAPPPQPCKPIEYVLLGLLAALFVAMIAMFVVQGRRFGISAPLALATVMVEAGVAWAWFEIRWQFRARLTEDGLWSEQWGKVVFTPWQGAVLWRRGYLVLVRNGAQEGRFNLAAFCTQGPIHQFLARKFPQTG